MSESYVMFEGIPLADLLRTARLLRYSRPDGSYGGECPACGGHLTGINGDVPLCENQCTPEEVSEGVHQAAMQECMKAVETRHILADAAAARIGESAWQPVDLKPILAGGEPDEQPDILHRTDGVGLFYRGRLHAGYGEPEAGKGWLALAAAVDCIRAGSRVLYVDYEDTAANVVARLRALGASGADIIDWFSYVRADEPLTYDDRERLLALEPVFVVIDGLTEAFAVEGLDMANNQDAAELYKRLARPFTKAGAAVLLIDHVVKDRENRGRYAIGAQHKLAGVDVAYRLDVAQPFGREREGLVKVTVTKDRPGFVRQHAADRERVAMMRLTSDDGNVTVTLEPGDGAAAQWRPTRYMERVSRTVEGSPGMTRRSIRDTVTGKNEHILAALDVLIAEKYVRENRDGRYPTHWVDRPFREAEDTQRSPGPRPVPDRSPEPLSGSGPPVPFLIGPGTAANEPAPTGSGAVVPGQLERAERLLADHADIDAEANP
jgi:KaiC/GvpD/RAD55 family RecA-like ATPase